MGYFVGYEKGRASAIKAATLATVNTRAAHNYCGTSR